MGRTDLVSIIIPAYNVEKYIQRCLESLFNQTYENIEIILIDDGSQDRTGEICHELSQKDTRLSYVYKKNEGQGIARNLGIELSKGEFITFADADDWCDSKYVEKMYLSMKAYHTDICVCDKYGIKLDDEGNIIEKKVIEQWMQPNERIEIEKNKNLIYQIKFSLWSKMFRRELLAENQILQPSHKFENNTVIPQIVSNAKYLSMVDEPLYYYWMNRKSSTINNIDSYFDMIKCLKTVDLYFKNKGIWNEYENALYGFSKWNIVHTLNKTGAMRNKTNENSYLHIEKELKAFLKETFPDKADWMNKHVTIWGSWNLKKTVRNIVPAAQIQHAFSYSSIVSAVSEGKSSVKRKKHKNEYRNSMIDQDIRKSFFYDKTILSETDALFIDLLEERFCVCEVEGSIYTKSDIFDEVLEQEVFTLERDEGYWKLWKRSCKIFIKKVLEQLKCGQIILVKYKLSSCYGSAGQKEDYPDIQAIREVNQWLDKAYEFFQEECKGCTCIEVDDEFMFTDKKFEYGCYPYYLNHMVYDQVAQEICRKAVRV